MRGKKKRAISIDSRLPALAKQLLNIPKLDCHTDPRLFVSHRPVSPGHTHVVVAIIKYSQPVSKYAIRSLQTWRPNLNICYKRPSPCQFPIPSLTFLLFSLCCTAVRCTGPTGCTRCTRCVDSDRPNSHVVDGNFPQIHSNLH